MTNDRTLIPSSVGLKEEWQEGKHYDDFFVNTEIQLREKKRLKKDFFREKVFTRPRLH